MFSAKLRLALAATLFLGWIGWLAYLVVKTRAPVILSRPQFLVSNLHVIAQLSGGEKPHATITVKKVAWPEEDSSKLAGTEITVFSLDHCGPPQGWLGPGDYILPLTRLKEGYRITPLPITPGYNPIVAPGPIRIYPATEPARQQLADINHGMK